MFTRANAAPGKSFKNSSLNYSGSSRTLQSQVSLAAKASNEDEKKEDLQSFVLESSSSSLRDPILQSGAGAVLTASSRNHT